MKVALYEILNNVDRYQYLKEATDWTEKDESYIRISDIVDIPFVMIDDALIIPRKVAKIREDKVEAMAVFDNNIAKLMAITYVPEDPEEPLTDFGEGLAGEEEGASS